MSARTDLDAFRGNFHALRHQSIGLFKKSLRVDNHAVTEHANFAAMNNAGRQQMEHERLIANLHGMAGVVSALVTRHDVEVFGKQVNYLALAFVTPLRAYDYDYF